MEEYRRKFGATILTPEGRDTKTNGGLIFCRLSAKMEAAFILIADGHLFFQGRADASQYASHQQSYRYSIQR
jgi:hypothetical protein